MRDPENVRQLITLPIDYIGFIFYDKSPRYVGPNLHEDILTALKDSHIKKTGVFVDMPADQLLERARVNELDVIQCHGDETPDYCVKIKEKGYTVIKAFRIGNEFDVRILNNYSGSCDYFLFDTYTKSYGGSGEQFDWNVLKKYEIRNHVFLSGGIDLDDAERIRTMSWLNIHAVDVNSRFETAPGIKNIDKIE